MFYSTIGASVVYTYIVFKNIGKLSRICRFSKGTIFYKGFYTYEFLMLLSRLTFLYIGIIFFLVSYQLHYHLLTDYLRKITFLHQKTGVVTILRLKSSSGF